MLDTLFFTGFKWNEKKSKLSITMSTSSTMGLDETTNKIKKVWHTKGKDAKKEQEKEVKRKKEKGRGIHHSIKKGKYKTCMHIYAYTWMYIYIKACNYECVQYGHK